MELLERHFDTAFDAPDGIKKLRELILTLAMQGKLVPQVPKDQPASVLLKEIEAEKKRLVKHGEIKEPKQLSPIVPEELPYTVPTGWEWVRLGTFLEMINGRAFKPTEWKSKGLPIVRIQNLNNPNASFNYCDESDVKEQHIIHENEFLISWSGTPGTSFGAFVWSGGKAALNQHIFRCSQIGKPFLDEFLRRAINNRLKFLISLAQGAVGLKHVTKGTLEDMPLPLPPRVEQSRIVAKIDELMARCDALEKLRAERDAKRLAVHSTAVRQLLNVADTGGHIQARDFLGQHFGELCTVRENVTELRKAILQLAVMGKLVPQDPKDPPASELLTQIEAEKKRLVKEGRIRQPKLMPLIPPEEGPFPLPRGWAWARFASLATEIATGPFGSMIHQSDYVTGGVPLVNPSHMIAGRIIHDPEIAIPEHMADQLQTYSLQENDIVMARRGEMGRCALVTAAEHGFLCGTGSFILRFITNVERNYILYFFRTEYCRDHLGGKSVGTTMTNLNQGILEAMPIPVAPSKEQHRIVAKINQLMSMCDTLEQQIDAARESQSALLNAMMAQYGGQRCA
jgi:type I restriction enzyme S subunit